MPQFSGESKLSQVQVDIIPDKQQRLTRTVLNVRGVCCAAEVPFIKQVLEPLHGVENVSVNFTTRTVTVLHNPLLAAGPQFVKVLNEARMDASLQHKVEEAGQRSYLSFGFVPSGVFMAVSIFQRLYSPLKWFAVAAVLVGAPRIALRAFASIRRLALDINVLMLIAVCGALALENYTEAGSIVVLFSFADWLQMNTVGKARDALAFAANLAPQTATLASSGHIVPLEEVTVGTAISVRAGEMIPLDGVIASGKTSVDESSLTGESRPSVKNPGDAVWAGTANISGYIVLETIATAEGSVLARMIRLVEEAQSKKSHIECIVEKFAKYYTPAVVTAAMATALLPLALHAGNENEWLYLSLVLVVVACPCALVVSTPVTTTCAIVQCAKMGLIVKGGNCLEALGKLRVLAMDKTGTLTEGHFRVLDVSVVDESINKMQLLQWMMSLESNSIHPIANAVVGYARLQGAGQPSQDIVNFQTIEGEGVSALVDGHLVEIGNSRLVHRQNWQSASENTPVSDDHEKKGASICWVGVDGRHVGQFYVADQVRPEALEAVQKFQDLGIKPLMLTGDDRKAASLASAQLDALEFHAELLPGDKLDIVQQAKTMGITGMVGDGVNDGPALAAADVGFAMGVAGSAIAMETADIALMTNDLRKIALAVQLGQKHRLKIMQNIFVSVFTKFAVAGLAVFGYAPLWLAVLTDVGTCVLVTLNSMLLLLFKPSSAESSPEAPAADWGAQTSNNVKSSARATSSTVNVTSCKSGCCGSQTENQTASNTRTTSATQLKTKQETDCSSTAADPSTPPKIKQSSSENSDESVPLLESQH